MSLFQCQNCGCVENTATSYQGFAIFVESFDWNGIEDRKGKLLCCMCGPKRYTSGKLTGFGFKWHDRFPRKFLPVGMFKTNKVGNIEHIETGEEDYSKYVLSIENTDGE